VTSSDERREASRRLSQLRRFNIISEHIKSVIERRKRAEDRAAVYPLCESTMCRSMNKHVRRKSSPSHPPPPPPPPPPSLFLSLFLLQLHALARLRGLLQLTLRDFTAYLSPHVYSARGEYTTIATRTRRKSDGRALLSVMCVGVKLRQGAQAQLRSWASCTWLPPGYYSVILSVVPSV